MIARYRYKFWVKNAPEPYYATFSMRVEILKETDTRYHIKFLEWHADGRRPDTITKVEKKSIITDTPRDKTVAASLRLPYKDD